MPAHGKVTLFPHMFCTPNCSAWHKTRSLCISSLSPCVCTNPLRWSLSFFFFCTRHYSQGTRKSTCRCQMGRRRGARRRFVPEFYDTHQPIIIRTSIPARPPPGVEEGKICFGKTVPARTRGLPLGAKRQTDVASLTAPRQRDSAMGLQFGAATSVAAHKADVPKKYRTAGSRRGPTRTGGPQFGSTSPIVAH